MSDDGAAGHAPLRRAGDALRAHHRICAGPPRAVPVWLALDRIPDWLNQARRACSDPPDHATKAAEWLLDNEYQIRRAVRQVQEDMPSVFYRRLPALSAPECDGLPRVFLAAHGLLNAANIQISEDAAVHFVDGYQGRDALSIAELWAFPAMLRLACLETIVLAFSSLVPGIGVPFARSAGMPDPKDLRDPTEAVSRAITALSAISRIRWEEFFERTSRVEAILRTDPAARHAAQDFETRDSYRRAIEKIAEGCDAAETDVADHAIRLARNHRGTPRQSHVGWWLVAAGRARLEAELGYRAQRRDALRRWVRTHPGFFYAGSLIGFGLAAMVLPAGLLIRFGAGPAAWTAGLLLSLMPASIISVTLTNWLVTQMVPPRLLPKLDFKEGLPDDMAAAVVVPVIFGNADEVAPLLDQLESHWLTNPDPRLCFAILGDPADAATEDTPQDAQIRAALTDGIARLNGRYPGHRPFAFLHRRRRWNPAEGVWMGWERKRGKLEEFNLFLAGRAEKAFPVQAGNIDALRNARYVVTLDSDTVMPPGSVKRLLGALCHPLNQVEFDAAGERVLAGYTFVQPRIEISPRAGSASRFSRLYTGDTAIDIYSRAVSDVYQDLFGAGIFTGKGAYDVAAFRQSLAGRVPENALVSHDLFEGLHGRAALASDIVFYEGFPASYPQYVRRLHRWIRGDWQLLPWLGRRVPGRGGVRLKNPLGALDRWKIIDNLRRSLIPPALVLLAVIGWVGLPGEALIWTLLTIAAPGAYLLTDVLAGLSRGHRRGAVRGRLRQFADHAGRWMLAVVFMAIEALVALDAVLRACWRMAVSRRRLLEWTTAAHVAAAARGDRAHVWAEMAGAPALALAIGGALALITPAALPGAAPLLLLWFLSPEIALFIGRSRPSPVEEISAEDRSFLRHLARRTWLFFETFAGPEDNWLPPDNFQTDPHEEVAHRSSPTNVGMMFLSSLAAWDCGHIGLRDLAARTTNTLDALDRLERYHGHVVNWFDTRSLEPLEPRYFSTVDSGNLAVSLLTLGRALAETADGPALTAASWDGLCDTLDLLRAATAVLPETQREAVEARIRPMRERASDRRPSSTEWRAALSVLQEDAMPGLRQAVAQALDAAPRTDPHEIHLWLERSGHHVASMSRDLAVLMPWQALIETAPDAAAPLARAVAEALPPDTPLGRICEAAAAAGALIEADTAAPGDWADRLRAAIESGAAAQGALRQSLLESAGRAHDIAMGMDFGQLYDTETRTFFIGYNLGVDRMDEHHYDLLASEARLASYFAIAKGDVPVEHWFHLGRPITRTAGRLTMLSWNGSMFEYLMPALLLRSAPVRLLGQSEVAAVVVQRHYGDRLGLPWGVSEAAFATRDSAQHYQYRAFGVNGLGLKQGLTDDYVVAPYASALALSVSPGAAVRNLRRLERMGLQGRYGFFDSVDFTPDRKPPEGDFAPVRTFMAHHQGMLLAAIDNALNDDILVRRFARDPRIAAMDLLLQERVPWEYTPETLPEPEKALPDLSRKPVPHLDGWEAPETHGAQLHLIGNGRMSAWITDTGGGALWWHDQSLTRWTADPERDEGGARLFLRDAATGATWSFGRRPPNAPEQHADVQFHPEKAVFHQTEHGIAATLEITVAEADDVEIRRVSLINDGPHPREIDLTSHAEVVLAPFAAHERHPAFSKLFVHSEHLPDLGALMFTRRPRRPGDSPPVLLHRLLADGGHVALAGFETDRRAYLGRHGRACAPAMLDGTPGNSQGWTLDPVCAMRARVRLAPGARVRLAFLTIAAGSRETALGIAARYAGASALDWAFEDARRSTAVVAHRLGLTQRALAEAQALSRHMVTPQPERAGTTPGALPGQPDLWGLGLSGDLPIILVRVSDADHATLLPVAVRAHRWWSRKGLRSDLVILSTSTGSYEEPVNSALRDALRNSGLDGGLGGFGGVHLHSADRIAGAQRRALENFAQITLDGGAGRLSEACGTAPPSRLGAPAFAPAGAPEPAPAPPLSRPDDLWFDNGLGGFSADGSAYHIHLEPGRTTPVPWCNVLANEGFGTIVSEAGLGFTWGQNSGENRLTPWSNDPVADPQGEAIYLRDEETGTIWTPTPLPAGRDATCQVEHGAGVTRWAQNSHGLEQRLSVLVPPDAPVKIARLRLANRSGRSRRVTVTYYAEWVLGALPSAARPHVVCGFDHESRALIARNGWSPEFAGRVAFLTASRPAHSLTCDRNDFLGRDGGRARPEGLTRWNLGGRTEGPADPCAAYQVHLDLAPDSSEEVVFVLGEGRDMADMAALAAEWANPERAGAAMQQTVAAWEERLGAVQVSTPDPAFDVMINRWLLYQSLAARIMARAGFSQASGGIGFRDQLQDVMALMISDPGRVRAHILDCAARQFEEGDVLHWWHPPGGRGVRTRCSDDLMWLCYATSRYVAATGDAGILNEEIPFLSAPPLEEDEEDRYALFEPGSQTAPLFEHCRRALEHGVTAGAHGLPLIGAGDWNDGMDRVGHNGRGESVWLAWFAAVCADGFADLAMRVERAELADHWRHRAGALRRAADRAGWDGAWYMRAFDDDGLPWGSAACDECRIDSISQSWAVIAGSDAADRAAQAMRSAEAMLVDHRLRLVRLLTPPFDQTPRDPGYIRAYPPGVRENGGQYTHAATWLGIAQAGLGDGEGAYRIFDLINPVRRSSDPDQVARYRGEPYSMPADVGGAPPFEGRAGWTWYTGAAAWAWRLGVEAILGLELRDGRLRIAPCLPGGWGGYSAEIAGPKGRIALRVEDPDGLGGGMAELKVDGSLAPGNTVDFPTDGSVRQVVLRICPDSRARAR